MAALIESERARAGESLKDAVSRLLRRGASAREAPSGPELPKLPGWPVLDVSDASALLATLDDERRAQRGIA